MHRSRFTHLPQARDLGFEIRDGVDFLALFVAVSPMEVGMITLALRFLIFGIPDDEVLHARILQRPRAGHCKRCVTVRVSAKEVRVRVM